jgi:uncharacterized membrane protein YphA (DoxX/SURF4 family)
LPCPGWVTDASTVLDVTAVLVAVATVLSAAELLALRADFRRYGLFDPRILSRMTPRLPTTRLAVLSMPRVATAQIVLGITTIFFVVYDISPTLTLVALAVAALLQRFLLPFGGDGSDMMARALTITLAIAFPLAYDATARRIALAFIAAQLCLAYGASGVAKLFGESWRSGSAVQRILHTGYGHAGLARSAVDRWPRIGKALTWIVIGLEIVFPIAVVLGGWLAFGALAAVAMLQLGIAVTMGLNRFTPWFVAAYPATAWAACRYGLLSP